MVHVSESAGYESIKKVLDFGIRRISHGVRAKDNDMKIIRLKENKIFIEICPTSNLQTKAFLRYEDLPVHLFY